MSDQKTIIKILDIDLDFFLNNKHIGVVTSVRRLNKNEYKLWAATEVEAFLENNCGLSKQRAIQGRYFVHHVEAFYFMRNLQENSDFSCQFIIDHVDAHGDLGTGDASYKYIASEILARSLK